MSNKSLGHVAYEKFHETYLPHVAPIPWEKDATLRAAWEAAAEAAVFAFVDTKRAPVNEPLTPPQLDRLHGAASWRAARLSSGDPEEKTTVPPEKIGHIEPPEHS